MVGRRRGRTGRGWDAAPPRRRRAGPDGAEPDEAGPDEAGPDGAGPDGGESDRFGPDGGAARSSAGASRAPRDPARRRAASADAASREAASRDPAEWAREICLRQLAVRPRTRAELATTLRRRGIADEVAAEVLDRYDEVGLIDDTAFARAWVSTRHQGKGLARRALGSELRQRGVAPETVTEALDELDSETEADTARTLVDRKLRTATGPPEVVLRRLVGMLARKGYPAGLAFRVVKEALADDERTAELADQLDPEALADAAGD